MGDEYHVQFRGYRDDFRLFQQHIIKGINHVDMDVDTMDVSRLESTLMNESSDMAGSRATPSSTQQYTPPSSTFESPDESGSSVGIPEKPRSNRTVSSRRLPTKIPASTRTVAFKSPAADSSLPKSSRKGHKKSRQGCFNCKKRKIKCQETQPACENCSTKNVECVYPVPKTLSALGLSSKYSFTPIASINLQPTPTSFSLTDMRLFHHYLLEAYPHLPVGNDTTWISQIPLIAHHNEYLMHAILGMAASHFQLLTGENLQPAAIHHRILAIKGSNEALLRSRRTGSDADALLASCYLLAFQSSYMSDGLQEFFRTVRGCSLVAYQLKTEGLPMAFYLTEKDHFDIMEERLMDLPVIHEDLVNGGKSSLLALTDKLDRLSNLNFYQALLEVLEAALVSSVQVYFRFIRVYHLVLHLENNTFNDFIDPRNGIGRILIAHFIAIQIVVGPIIDREWAGRHKPTPVAPSMQWIYSVNELLPSSLRQYMAWPVAIADSVGEELTGGTVAVVPKISILRKREGLGKGFF